MLALATRPQVRAVVACTLSARALSTAFRPPTSSPEAPPPHMRSLPPLRVPGHDASEHITISFSRDVRQATLEEPDDGMCYTPSKPKAIKRPIYQEADVRALTTRK